MGRSTGATAMNYDELVRFANWMQEHHPHDCLDCRGNDREVMLEAHISPDHVEQFNRSICSHQHRCR